MTKETRYIITASIGNERVNVFKNERSYKSEVVAEKRAAWFAVRLDSVRVEPIKVKKIKK